MTEDQLLEKCRQAIQSGEFVDTTTESLDPWTATLAQQFLQTAQLRWQISQYTVGKARIIKICDQRIKYLISLPNGSYQEQKSDQFFWLIGDDPTNADHLIHPDMASAYLLSKAYPGIRIRDIRAEDGSCLTQITLPNGSTAEIHFPAELFKDKTYAEEV